MQPGWRLKGSGVTRRMPEAPAGRSKAFRDAAFLNPRFSFVFKKFKAVPLTGNGAGRMAVFTDFALRRGSR